MTEEGLHPPNGHGFGHARGAPGGPGRGQMDPLGHGHRRDNEVPLGRHGPVPLQ